MALNDHGTMCDTQESRVTKVITSSHLINPLILKIDNRSLTSDEIEDSECLWLEDISNSSPPIVSLSNNDNINYRGIVKESNSLCKTIIALQNRKTNKVKLIEMGESDLQRVLPKKSTQTNYDNDGIEITVEENRSKLLKAFGSKRSNRVSDMNSRMQINLGMMSSKLENTATNVVVSVEEIQQAELSIDTCLPPCHRDADTPGEVYIIQDFLTNQELDSMEDEVAAVSQLIPFKMNGEESRYTQFCMEALNKIQYKMNDDKIKVLLYVNALIKFYNMPMYRIKKSNIIKFCCPWSSVVGTKILETFTVVGGPQVINRDSNMDDKLVVHIIVLVIIACESCNLKTLRKDLPRISNLKMEQMAKALCLSSWDKNTWCVKLPLPSTRSRAYKKKR